jgi:hypothetical protein
MYIFQAFGSITFELADPDHMKTDLPENMLKFETSEREIYSLTSDSRNLELEIHVVKTVLEKLKEI